MISEPLKGKGIPQRVGHRGTERLVLTHHFSFLISWVLFKSEVRFPKEKNK